MNRPLLHSPNLELESLFVITLNEVVIAIVFIATTARVALTETENFVYRVCGSYLDCYNGSSYRADLLLVSWIKKFFVPSVARTSLCVSATIGAGAKSLSFDFLLILFDIFIVSYVFLDVLKCD